MSNDEEPVEFEDVRVKAETELAILCEIDGKEVWIPRSQVHDDSEVSSQGDEGTLILARWFAEKEGLV
jgi:hypothetical protein